LPEFTYANLRAEAEKMPVPATTLARDRQDAIAAYAAEMAGTDLDLDSGLESAAMDRSRRTVVP
jgi:hypothetical protein